MKLVRKFPVETIFACILTGALSWSAWVTISLFASQKVDAVTENKYENIIATLSEIKTDVKAIKNK